MAKKPANLTFADIVLGADAETIRKALEAREEIDRLLVEREAAYRQIAEIEAKVDDVVGEDVEFPFPDPPLPVFGFGNKTTTAKKKPAAKKAPASPAPATTLGDNKDAPAKGDAPGNA